MIANYLKLAWRHIISQKKYSLVVIFGMAVSIVAAFLIFSYVKFEKGFDNFHTDADHLFRVVVDAKREGNNNYKSPYSFSAQGPTALEEIPEVLSYTRLIAMNNMVLSSQNSNGDNSSISVKEFYYADDNFFSVFTFPFLWGDNELALKEPGSIAISSSIAQKLFGNENPVGKSILIDGKYKNTITGVFYDAPENTHFKFDLIGSLHTIPFMLRPENSWSNHSFFTYLKLKDGAIINEVEAKLKTSFTKENRAITQSNLFWELQPITEAYLNTSDFTSTPNSFKFGDKRMVYFMSLIALLILGIAWINYINLTTAKSTERLKEIEIRKTNGAGKKQLLTQFFIETTLYNLLSMCIASAFIAITFQWFFKTMALSTQIFTDPSFWYVVGSVVIFGILFPGLYSALLLSGIGSRKRSNTIKNGSSQINIRHSLIIIQFMVIIILISGLIVINRQLNHINSIDLGFQKEQVVVLNIPRVDFNQHNNSKLYAFENELKKSADIEEITASVSVPSERFGNGNGGPSIIGYPKQEDAYFRVGRVLPNYPEFYNIDLLTGRYFDETDNGMIINKEALAEFGFYNAQDIINKEINWQGSTFTILGVTKSFHQESLHILPEPLIFYTKDIENQFNYISVKLLSSNHKAALSKIEKVYSSFFPNDPFAYFFLDKHFDQQYKKDIAFRQLFTFFSILALLIGYMGLYGLTTYSIVKRIKEIGIRKVNGAKDLEILSLLNKDYIKWIAIAFFVACPVSWIIMGKWLQNFAYKTTLNWWIFALAGFIALAIALITVSWQTFRAARRNPVEALRYE
ncbi:MAG: ABC transporter permease [Salinivirgaceae bacterium]|jgi:putative ABC transport system permease protein|nr:ABC transporter permease [Salinivirgaceae bacterium]